GSFGCFSVYTRVLILSIHYMRISYDLKLFNTLSLIVKFSMKPVFLWLWIKSTTFNARFAAILDYNHTLNAGIIWFPTRFFPSKYVLNAGWGSRKRSHHLTRSVTITNRSSIFRILIPEKAL